MPEKTKVALESLSQTGKESLEFGQLLPNAKIKSPGSLFPRIEE